MTLACVLLSLTLLHTTLASEWPCRWSRVRLVDVNDRCIQLLNEMNEMSAHFPVSCVTNERARFYPQHLYENNTSDSLTTIAMEAVQAVAEVYRGNMSSVSASWRRDKVDLFTNLLSRQKRKLEPCVKSTEATGRKSPGLKLYTDQLKSFLTHQGNSLCAWEMARAEARHVLQEMKTLLKDSKRSS